MTDELKPCSKDEHIYEEVSSPTDMEGETYRCTKCGDRYRLYYEDMK